MTENKLLAIAAASAGVLVVITANKIINNITYNRRAKQVKADTTAEIARIRKAGDKVAQMIKDGKYDKYNSVLPIFADFEFERLVADIEE